MAGLLRRAVGAGLAGLGAGIVQQAAQTREESLMRLRRKWQTEDRDLAHKRSVEAASRSEARADQRARAAHQRTLEARAPAETFDTVESPFGRGGVGQRSSTSGRIVNYQQPQSADGRTPKLTLLSEDLEGRRTYGVFDPQAGGIVPVGVVGSDGAVMDDMTGDDDGPGWFERMWNSLTGEDEPEAEADRPAGMPADARRAPDGKWYVPDPQRPGKWMKVRQ